MASLKAAKRNKLPDSVFADPKNRRFPVHDKTHAVMAWKMLNRAEWPEGSSKEAAQSKILRALKRFGVDTASYEKHSTSAMSLDVEQMDIHSKKVMLSFLTYDVDSEDEELCNLRMALSEALTAESCETDDCDEPLTDTAGLLRVPVARLGSWYHPVYRVVTFSQRDFDDMIRNFETDELGFPPYMRYGHDVGANRNVVDDDPARGTILSLYQEGEVLFSLVAATDEDAVDDVKAQRMRYSSAELIRNAESKHDGANIGTLLKAISLTNAPFVPNLPNCEALSEATLSEMPTDFFVLNMSKEESTVTEDVAEVSMEGSAEKEEPSLISRLAQAIEDASTLLASMLRVNEIKKELSDEMEHQELDTSTKNDIVISEEGAVEATQELEATDQQELTQDEQISPEESALSSSVTGQEQEKSMEEKEVVQEPQAAPAANDEHLSQLASLEERLAQLEAKLQTEEAEKEALKGELDSAKASLEETSKAAEMFSNALANEKLSKLKEELVGECIPPVMVEQAFSLVAALPEKEMKLSDGASVSLYDKMAEVLRLLPQENRVKLSQVGHNLSTGATAVTSNPYQEILERYQTSVKNEGKK